MHGFAVTVIRDPDHEKLKSAFNDFINSYGHDTNNRLLFYFAGHGHTIHLSYGADMGYIVPVDAPDPDVDKSGFLAKALDMQQFEVYARRIESKHALFLFDSCFSGSIFALERAIPKHISYKTARPVRQFITSGSADETVPDKSIFRHQFLEALDGEADVNEDGYITASELGEFLFEKVVNYSRGTQHPQYGKIRDMYLDKGDFVFLLASIDAVAKKHQKGRLYVDTEPENARVRILNIKPRFFQGMELESGSYHVEVAAEGYKTERRWIELDPGKEKQSNFELAKISDPQDLPRPNIIFGGTEEYEVRGRQFKRYKLLVTNWASYPAELFKPAPDLPPCGLNKNSSRTWVHIYDGLNQRRIYGFCALTSPEELTFIWFSVEKKASPPRTVYVVLFDRRKDVKYISDTIELK
jgi:hypothetical protein